MEIKLVIDGHEVMLVPNGHSQNYDKFKEPDSESGKQSLIASVYVKPSWKPGKGS